MKDAIYFKTDAGTLAAAIETFERELPGWWWSIGNCTVGAHASCAPDGKGIAAHYLDKVKAGDPLDTGFHCDTNGGQPADALRDVMEQALEYLKAHNP